MSTRFLEELLRVNGLLDVRHLYKKDTGEDIITTGMFNNLDDLRTAVSKKSKRGNSLLDYGNFYVGLNRPVGMLCVRNQMQTYKRTVKDSDIMRFTHLLFDFDPVRQTDDSHCPSTDTEHSEAKQAAYTLLNHLRMLGWPTPLIASSGNGWHLVYRVNLLNEPAISRMLKKLYQGLKVKFSTELVEFDSKVYNAGRITRLYSTVNRKGKQSADRPYRKSFCLMPPDWQQVSGDQVISLYEQVKIVADPVSRRREGTTTIIKGKGDYRTLDIVSLFQANGLYEHHIDGRWHSVTCPWEHEHTSGGRNDTTIVESDGSYPNFDCKHDHCSGRYLMSLREVFRDMDAYCTRKLGDEA